MAAKKRSGYPSKTAEAKRAQRQLDAEQRQRIAADDAELAELDKLKAEACAIVTLENIESLRTAVARAIEQWFKKQRAATARRAGA